MDPNALPAIASFGAVAFVIWIVLAVLGFVVSAFITSLYLRLVIRFSRKALDREYRYMRGDYYAPPSNTTGATQRDPRSW
jgi:hypothetical protein